MAVIVLKPKKSKDSDKRKYLDLSVKTKRYRFYRNFFFISLSTNIKLMLTILWLLHKYGKI